MAIIPINKKTCEYKIENSYLYRKPRPYLGMSGIGNDCLRAQWYSWRWAVKELLVARTRRIFDRGHYEEAHIIRDLKEIGVECYRMDGGKKIEIFGEKGEEQEEIIGCHGHEKGHPDGRAINLPESPKKEHLLEFKSMQDKYFQALKEKGLREGFPSYYSQLQRYMGGINLTRALFIATNKNDQARKYIRIKLDQKHFEKMVERGEKIIMSESPPQRVYKQEHYKCQWCKHHQVCWLGKEPEKNCRTCEHGDIYPDGEWKCGLKDKTLSYKKQLKGCKKHKRLF